MTERTEQREYVTGSIPMAAFLTLRGLRVLRVEDSRDREAWRLLVFPYEALAVSREFDKALVPVKAFSRAMKDMRALTRVGIAGSEGDRDAQGA